MTDLEKNLTNAAMNLERRKIVRWLAKYYPENKKIILQSVCSAARILNDYGFEWMERSLDGDAVTIPGIEFDKKIDATSFYFVSIDFQKYGYLQFTVTFGVRKLGKWRENEREYYRSFNLADFVKIQDDGYYRAKLWGARWYHLKKIASFQNDWRKFEKTIPYILKYLENFTPHPNIYWTLPRIDLNSLD